VHNEGKNTIKEKENNLEQGYVLVMLSVKHPTQFVNAPEPALYLERKKKMRVL